MKAGAVALMLVTSAGVPQIAQAQDLPVAIDQADLAELLACTDEASCAEALQALLELYAQLYPGVDLNAIVGAVAAQVAEAYNSGGIAPAIAGSIFTSMTRIPGVSATLARAIQAAVVAVSVGNTLDLAAIASGAASAN